MTGDATDVRWSAATVRVVLGRHGWNMTDVSSDFPAPDDRGTYNAGAVLAWLGY